MKYNFLIVQTEEGLLYSNTTLYKKVTVGWNYESHYDWFTSLRNELILYNLTQKLVFYNVIAIVQALS